jgi:hypothetical protein
MWVRRPIGSHPRLDQQKTIPMQFRITFSLLALFATAALASAQQPVVSQPYTLWRAAHTSTVVSCNNPAPFVSIALDDFGLQQATTLSRVTWWGELLCPTQAQRNAQAARIYYIAIYPQIPGACRPSAVPIYEACVNPDDFQQIGQDCTNRVVYSMTAPLPGNPALAAGKYWLQISEDDADSVGPGQVNFRWSAHRPIVNCRALRTNNLMNFAGLNDACDNLPNDLAFVLFP